MFGGGYAMIPLLEKELIEKRKWITSEDLLEIIAFSQMTPGTIAINTATHIGNTKGKALGGVLASLGIIIPSLVIITTIYYLAGRHFENEIVQKAFTGIRACLFVMICKSVYKMMRSGIKESIGYVLFLIAVLALFMEVHPILIIICGGIAGYILTKMNNTKKQKG